MEGNVSFLYGSVHEVAHFLQCVKEATELPKGGRITPLGWEIKRRLAERHMDQSQFCKMYNIPPSRLSEIITGRRKAETYRKRVMEVLGIEDGDQQYRFSDSED